MTSVKVMCESDAKRVEAIRRWHIDQAVGSHVNVALLNIAVNFDGEIETNGLCIEPQHIEILLPELRRLARLLEADFQATLTPIADTLNSSCRSTPSS